MSTTFVDAKAYEGRQVTVASWDAPPAMEGGSPAPALRREESCLFLAYVCRNPAFPGWDSGAPADHPGFDTYSAVIRFDGVSEHYVGPPGDEAIDLHPLHAFGLESYGFWEVLGSPKAVLPLRHWVCTFHDEVIEVVAEEARVIDPRVPGEDTHAIVRSC